MSATKETIYEQIVQLRKKIDETQQNGDDTTQLKTELQSLNTKLMNLCEAEQKNANLLRG